MRLSAVSRVEGLKKATVYAVVQKARAAGALMPRLQQLQRQTKGCTKSLRMLRDSLALVCRRLGLI